MGKIEKIYPYLLSSIVIFFIFVFNNNEDVISIQKKILDKDILNIIITIESILFGFLMTVLSLIVQMNNKAIELIKTLGRYNDLINYSKASIYGALMVVLVSFIIILKPERPNTVLSYICIYLMVFSLLSLFRFVHIFFKLAKSGQ